MTGGGVDRGNHRLTISRPGYLRDNKVPRIGWEIYSFIAENRIPRTNQTRPLSHRQIAAAVHIDRTNVNRYMRTLKAAGAIEVVSRGTGPGARSVYRVVGTETVVKSDDSSTPDRSAPTRATVVKSDYRTVVKSDYRTVVKSDDPKKKGNRKGRSPEEVSVFIKTGGSAGRDAPLRAPSPSENAVKTAAHEAATYAKKARLKREQLIEKICRYLPTAYDGDELERRLVGLASPDPAVAQHWLDQIDRERRSRGWDDKPRRRAA
jgi:hypothetical protein